MYNEFSERLLCPVCSLDYVHFEEPYMDNKGLWAGRGQGIIIPMWCENEHKWDLIIGHHKGMSYIHSKQKSEILLFASKIDD